MPDLRVMTFNVENMLTRFNFKEYEKESLATLLDIDSEIDRANLVRTHWNIINDENRVFTALSMREGEADIICLQEVENLRALKIFHDRYLRRIGKRDYPYQILIEGNDPRGIDVAVLSRYKISSVTTHQDKTGKIKYLTGPKTEQIFRRDCLEVNVKKNNKILPIFVCHFKSMIGGRKQTKPVREAEAYAVREIIEERFGNPAEHDWLVVGDLNDYTETDGQPDNQHSLGALVADGFAVDLVKRIADPLNRWSHYYDDEDHYGQLDYILASPALAAKNPQAIPTIIRQGQPYRARRYTGERWPRVGYDRPKASDHCPVVVSLKY
jgi:predicted extracellular nuclease